MPIPKLIFQTWKTKELPDNFSYWSKTLREENPLFAYRLWDDADNRAFISSYFPWFLETYDAYPAEIYRADAVRYFFLYRFGGFYADLDMECLRPLDPIANLDTVVLGRMGGDPEFDHSLPNAMMASPPRQEFWLLVMSLLLDPMPNDRERPEYVTGPVLLKRAYDLYTREYREDRVQNRIANIRSRIPDDKSQHSDFTILPNRGFFPLDWSDAIHNNFVRRAVVTDGQMLDRKTVLALFPNSYTVTYWSHSWEDQNEQ